MLISTLHEMLSEGLREFSWKVAKGNEHVFKTFYNCSKQNTICATVFLYFNETEQNTEHCFIGRKEYFVVHFTALRCPGEDETLYSESQNTLLASWTAIACIAEIGWEQLNHIPGSTSETYADTQWLYWLAGKQSTESPRTPDRGIQNTRKKEPSPHTTLWHSTLNIFAFLSKEKGSVYFMKEEISLPNCALVPQDRRKAPLSSWTARDKSIAGVLTPF